MAVRMIECVITTVAAGQLCQNVTHWVGDVSPTNLYQVAKKFNAGLITGAGANLSLNLIRTVFSADAFISSISAKVRAPTVGGTAYDTFAVDDWVGALSADIYAQSVAGVMRLFTPVGPDYTGRVFLPAVPTDCILEGRFTLEYQTAFNLLRDAWLVGVDSDDGQFTPVVLKRSNMTWESVIHAQLAINPGTIRKRLIPV